VRLVATTVVRLERTLAHENALRVSGVCRDLFSDRVWARCFTFGWHRPPAANDLSSLC
jgi:hypothetical protein